MLVSKVLLVRTSQAPEETSLFGKLNPEKGNC